MKNQSYVDAISFLSIMSIVFLYCFVFNLTQYPLFLLHAGMATFGYMLFLLGFGTLKKSRRSYCYIIAGLSLLLISFI